jgi:ABC-type transporter Mla MlaB component
MTTIETYAAQDSTTIRVQGELADEQVPQLERCWRQNRARAIRLHLDLCDVHRIGQAGKSLVSRMFADGVELIVRSRPHK